MQTSIVPDSEHTTYLLLDEMTNQHVSIWPEISADEANEATIVQWIIEGQFSRPIKIVAFNTEDGWSRDVTQEIATKLLDLNQNGVALGATAIEFIERVTGQSTTAIV
jgi:hypothetical protein